jgi:hypothetical protein
MSRYVGLTALPLVALLAISTPSIAQQDGDSRQMISMMPLRADKITVDAERGYVLLRGSMDWPDGRTTTSVVIMCENRELNVRDHTEGIDTHLYRYVDPDFCNQLARRIQPHR